MTETLSAHHCKNCIHWIDESLAEIEADGDGEAHLFMGCKVFGEAWDAADRRDCPRFAADPDPYTLCAACKTTVPKVCVSLGECANCTDTDLYCVESCIGGEARKYCTHFVRLHTEGMHLVDDGGKEVYDLFPTLGMPGAPAQGGVDGPAAAPPKGAPILIDIRSRHPKRKPQP
ncbi:MAG: hypothetical protein LBT74_03720 [Acidobacteriota bacterium]|jgi:hypothetical protein|nr:hypothetical protein [Acidobacteriota bacterium]